MQAIAIVVMDRKEKLKKNASRSVAHVVVDEISCVNSVNVKSELLIENSNKVFLPKLFSVFSAAASG